MAETGNMRLDEEKARQAALAKKQIGSKHAIVFEKHHLPYNPGDQVGFSDREVAARFVNQGFARWDERFHDAEGGLKPQPIKAEAVPEQAKTVRK